MRSRIDLPSRLDTATSRPRSDRSGIESLNVRRLEKDLRHAAERYHLTFAPDPSTHEYCTLGGMIGNNSCGVHSVMGGLTADNVEELEILTFDGLRLTLRKVDDDGELQRII